MLSCKLCGWQGVDDALHIILTHTPANANDKTLFNQFTCPDCGGDYLDDGVSYEFTIDKNNVENELKAYILLMLDMLTDESITDNRKVEMITGSLDHQLESITGKAYAQYCSL